VRPKPPPELDDAALVAGFEAHNLRAFPHEDHVRLVYLLIRRHGEEEALRRVSEGILAMAVAGGRPDAFHVTRTVAWTRLVAAAGEHGDSRSFLAANPHLARRDLLDDYYDRDRLSSDAARTGFIEPDRPMP
jgi:hypothetical protein